MMFSLFSHFPSKELRKGGELAATHYREELESIWGVGSQDFIYTDEERPLDIYRTIMRINEDRELVFKTFRGSMLILSPLGSRMPAIGMLMAALEGDFPVVYVETLNYHVEDWGKVDEISQREIWKSPMFGFTEKPIIMTARNLRPLINQLIMNKYPPSVYGTGLISLDIIVSMRPEEHYHWSGGTCGNVLTILSYLGWESFPIARLNSDTASVHVKSRHGTLGCSLGLCRAITYDQYADYCSREFNQ